VTRVLLQNTWRQVRAFLIDAGTTILALTIIVWAVLSYPRDKALGAHFASERAAIEQTVAPGAERNARLDALAGQEHGDYLRGSVGGHLGRWSERDRDVQRNLGLKASPE
jgi:ferrous iron transport protein B